jgi:hypothetical protein
VFAWTCLSEAQLDAAHCVVLPGEVVDFVVVGSALDCPVADSEHYPITRGPSRRWIRYLVDGRRHEIDGRLLEARSRLGSWCRVADELTPALAEMGKQWECERLTIAEEHVCSDALTRALARMGDTFPTRLDGPRGLLACASSAAYGARLTSFTALRDDLTGEWTRR